MIERYISAVQAAWARAPYLTDPTTENLLRLRDKFRRSGREVVFTREATYLEEEPMPFTNSQIQTKFRHLTGRAFEMSFAVQFLFENATEKSRTVHFVFSLPQAGTIRDLNIQVNGQAVPEPSHSAGAGASTVAAIYLGTVAGVLLGPLPGAILSTLVLERRALLVALPAALLPATFLSAQNSGLLVALLVLASLAALIFASRSILQPKSVRG